MATAIFHSDFNYSSRKTNAGWSVRASKEPQTFPRELIDAAVRAGVATRAKKDAPSSRQPRRDKQKT